MAIEDDIKAAELETRKLEILQRQKDLGEKRRFGLASAAVLVTILGGLAAVLFQGIGFLTSTQDKENAEIAAASDFDFKGLELFVKEQDHLITCDPDESARNLKLFNDLFSKRVTAGFSEVVAYRSQKCIAQSQNSGAAEAEAKTKGAPLSTEEIAAAADVARYAAAALQASLLDASTAANAPARQKYRAFIQINSEADRIDAAALQAALNSKGYSAPGIELVSSAPEKYEVRYYNKGEESDAGTLASIARSTLKLGSDPAAITISSLEGKFKSLPKDTMEFWFPRRK